MEKEETKNTDEIGKIVNNGSTDDGATPYDDAFKTLLNDCRQLVIPLINEIFKENYSGNEKVVFSNNEHYLNWQGGKEEKRITDSLMHIVSKDDNGRNLKEMGKGYHIECESKSGNKVLIRLFEYDAQIALDEGKDLEGNRLEVSFPHSAVMFLRSTSNTPDAMKMVIKTPGGSVSYDVPVLKMSDYTSEVIFEKKLYILIPFLIFNYEKDFNEIEHEKEKLKNLEEEFKDIVRKLEELVPESDEQVREVLGGMDEYTRRTLLEMASKVLRNVAVNYKNIREGVGKIMGGQVLDYEAKRILNKGIAIGEERGKEIGKEIGEKRGIVGCINLLRKKMGLDDEAIVETIMEEYNLSEDEAWEYLDSSN